MMCHFFRKASLASFALSLAAAAWGQSEPESYASREYGVYFDVPAGWKLDRKPKEGLVAVRDSLGLLEITLSAEIVAKKRDVREFADKAELGRGLAKKGAVLAQLVADPALDQKKREVLKPLVYDDTERVDKARKEYEEAEAKRPVDVSESGDAGAIPDERQFLAEMTTRLYEAEDMPKALLVFYVIGGGVGYTVTVAAEREGFYAALPLAQDVITAMKLDRLSGGRYALPNAKALAAAKRGIIMGKVLANGRPVGGAAVNLYADAAQYTKGVPTYRSRSNGYGEYTFTQLETGRYYLLEVYGVSDAGERVRSVQPITNIDVVEGRIVFVNIEVSHTQ
jgi:hypothetical protein